MVSKRELVLELVPCTSVECVRALHDYQSVIPQVLVRLPERAPHVLLARQVLYYGAHGYDVKLLAQLEARGIALYDVRCTRIPVKPLAALAAEREDVLSRRGPDIQYLAVLQVGLYVVEVPVPSAAHTSPSTSNAMPIHAMHKSLFFLALVLL